MTRELQYISANLTRYSGFSPFSAHSGRVTATTLNRYISPLQFERVAHDIGMWRDAIKEAELAWHPSRVKIQRMLMDVSENPHVKLLIERLEEIVLQRTSSIYQLKGDKKIISKDLSQQIDSQSWVADYKQFALHSILFGYGLISLGDCVEDKFPRISVIPRENILPDGIDHDGKPILTSMVYSVNGISVTDDPMIDMCNHWVPTRSNRGVSTCGYGLLYNVALCEIHLRHILEWNMDFAEQYGQPIKKGTTSKTGKARAKFEAFLASGASNQWVMLDKGTGDNVEYTMAANAGTAWKTYDNIEARLKALLSQLFLGHTDAASSTPGKLGGMQNSNKEGNNISLVQQAINSKSIRYGDYVSRVMNDTFAPKMRRLGKYVGSKTIRDLIPAGYTFGLQNDAEEEEILRRKNHNRDVTSQYVKNFNDSGWDVDADELSEHVQMKMTAKTPERKIIEERNTLSTVQKIEPKIES